ncbi:MAG TPA: metallophosphoesterase [Daejeonella sp.]|nr:metallophosphoesterase [Daejeonella sp.]
MKKISRRKFIIDGITLTSLAFVLDACWLEQFFIETNEFYLGEARKHGSNLKFIQISDLHLHSIGLQHKLLAEKINHINPDLLFFTGDSIDRGKYMTLFEQYLSLFDPHILKVAILGNREYNRKISIEELKHVYARHNADLLINESKQYTVKGHTIAITGCDDFIGGDANFPLAVKNYIPSDYHIVLTHCPEHRDILQEEQGQIPIDCILSGHTHGGQIRILGFAPYTPEGSGRYVSGWYRENACPPLYVSKGIGTTIWPIRFGARSEIAIFNFELKEKSKKRELGELDEQKTIDHQQINKQSVYQT